MILMTLDFNKTLHLILELTNILQSWLIEPIIILKMKIIEV